MVQVKEEPEELTLCDMRIEALSGVDINDAVARLQSRGNAFGNNIFEILPRFSITAGESNNNWEFQYSRRRQETLAVTGGGDVTGILVGCELLAFERNTEELSKQIHFPASVDFVVWRRSILLIGLSSSEVILVDPNTYRISYRWQAFADIDDRKRFFVDAFIHTNPDPTKIDVIVVSQAGLVCTFEEISLSDGTLDATHDQNTSLNLDLGSIKDISKHTLSISSKISCACSPTRSNLIVIEEAGNILIVDLLTNVENLYVTLDLYASFNYELKFPIVAKKVTAFEGNFFVLLSNGVLEIFTEGCSYCNKPLKLPASESSIYDFSVVRNNNEQVVKLWVLYSQISGSKTENYVGIFVGPAFTLEFNFQLPVFDKSEESSLFKFPKNLNPYEEPSTIVEMASNSVLLYHILETSTDVTLQKLLSRGKYLEAKDLAENYGKDLDIVRKAEARDKLSTIIICHTSAERKNALDILWMELLQILKEITDAEFVCKFCMNTNLPRIEWVKEILALGKGRVTSCTTSAAAELLLTLKKFYTFELVYPCGTINEWEYFVSPETTMYLQSLKFLQNNNYEKCERIWKRHSEEFISLISLKDFLPFFNILFDHQLRTMASVSLLKTILPFSVEKLVQSVFDDAQLSNTNIRMKELDVLIGIIQRQVSTLENRVDWPINALNFITVLNSVIKEEIKRLSATKTESKSIIQKKLVMVNQIRDKLDRFEQILEELAELKKNHSIRILFHDYTNNEIPEVINKLLYKLLSKEEVESFVSKYLRPYAKRKNLDVDFLFSEHIKSVLEYIHYFIQIINIPHEERIICLVNLISSIKVKLSSALLISEEWPVPWTPGIADMIDRILNIPRSTLDQDCLELYDKISLMKKQVPYRCVVNKYKLNIAKLCSRRSYISMALLRIFKLRKLGFQEDGMELLKHVQSRTLIDEVHLQYIEFMLRLYDKKIEEDDVVPYNIEANGSLRKALLHRVFVELQIIEDYKVCKLYTGEESMRCIKIYSILTNGCQDMLGNILCKLKQFLPNIPLDVISNPEFPYACLSHLFQGPDSCIKDPQSLISDCKKLSQIITAYLPDVLIFVGLYYVQLDVPDAVPLLWCLVEHIVNTPLNLDMNNTFANRELLQSAAYQIASALMLQCPVLSLAQMSCLEEFMCRLSSSFDKICCDIGLLLCFLRIFFGLKEQEIPLETEFLEVYKWCAGINIAWDSVKQHLSVIKETLLKFGDPDLSSTILKSVQRHVEDFIPRLGLENPYLKKYYMEILQWIKTENAQLMQPSLTEESVEADSQMQKLVRDLNAAGIRVNEYALKLRDKLKLLERLLNSKDYMLAGNLAIAFSYYDNLAIWSRILEGLVVRGNLDHLRRILEIIRTVPQLWMLPEFSMGWKKVSEVDATFIDLCPIPLE